jgi:hypothetical protein
MRSVVKTTVVKLATVKLAIAALATTGTAGVAALAASTGALPSPFTLHAPAVTPSTSGTRHTTEPSTGDRRPGAANALPPPASLDPGATSHAPSPPTVPSLSLSALCDAYVMGTDAQRLSALEMPDYAALIEAAGGKDKVDAYCANLLNLTPPTGSPTPTPTGSSTPDPTPDPTTPGPTSSGPTTPDPLPAVTPTPTPNGSSSSATATAS